MSLYKSLVFDGIDSMQYGIYITGSAVYDAPARAVDMVSVPGRNGALAIDQGRFENVELTYQAGCFASTQSDFADKVRAFRNELCARYSYARLADGYNENEYRLALFSSGLTVDPTVSSAGTFDIVFNCKPQRYLTSGETSQSISSGGTITNPTGFPSRPLIKVTGHGDLSVGDYDITIDIPETDAPIFIDCDIMESYQENGGTVEPVNSIVSLSGPDYPVLAPGATSITFDSGITRVDVTPRWWRI